MTMTTTTTTPGATGHKRARPIFDIVVEFLGPGPTNPTVIDWGRVALRAFGLGSVVVWLVEEGRVLCGWVRGGFASK